MPHLDALAAVRHRDAGLRGVARLTRRAAVAAVVLTAAIVGLVSYHTTPTPGGIVIPSQAPHSGSGPGQVTSGGS